MKTDTDTQHPYELLVPLRYSQCSLSSTTTERRSLKSSWQSIRPVIIKGAPLSACEGSLLKEQATLEGKKWGFGHKGVQSPLGLCSQQSFLCSWRADHERTLHCFVLFFVVFILSCFGDMSMSLEYVRVPWKHIYITRWVSSQTNGKGWIFGRSEWLFYLQWLLTRQTPQHHDHRLLITYDLICFLRCYIFSILKIHK